MNKMKNDIMNVSENFNQMIHDYCEALNLDPADFFSARMKVEEGCKIADHIVRKSYNLKVDKSGFEEPEVRPRVIKGTKEQVMDAIKKPMAGMGIDIERDVRR